MCRLVCVRLERAPVEGEIVGTWLSDTLLMKALEDRGGGLVRRRVRRCERVREFRARSRAATA